MKRLILAAASAVALGIGGVGVGHAALTSTPGPSSSSGQTSRAACNPNLSSSSGQNIRDFGYGVPQQLAKYQQFNLQQSGRPQQHALIRTPHENQNFSFAD
jgi:hypothetical protein